MIRCATSPGSDRARAAARRRAARRAARVAALAAAVLAGACAPPPRPAPVAPSGSPPPLVLEVITTGASHYNAPPPPPAPGPPGDRITALVREAAVVAGRPAPRRDARLDAVCGTLARVLPDDRHTPFELVEFALQHVGLIEPAPRLILAHVTPDGAAAFVAGMRRRLPLLLAAGRYRRLGVGVLRQPGEVRLVVALQESFLETAPFPRVLPRRGRTTVHGRLDPAFTSPRAYVTRPDGTVGVVDVTTEAGGTLRFEIECSAQGRHQVEMTADDRLGATVVANFPVYCDSLPPRRAVAPAGLDLPVRDTRAAARQLFDLLNADRRRHHIPTLDWDERLAALGRAHSQDMADGSYVGHVSPRFGDAEARIRRAHIEAGFILENVARAFSAGEAHRGLMASPAHRRNILSTKVTKVGIGVALGSETAGRREIYVTEIFVKPPRKLAPGEEIFTIP